VFDVDVFKDCLNHHVHAAKVLIAQRTVQVREDLGFVKSEMMSLLTQSYNTQLCFTCCCSSQKHVAIL